MADRGVQNFSREVAIEMTELARGLEWEVEPEDATRLLQSYDNLMDEQLLLMERQGI